MEPWKTSIEFTVTPTDDPDVVEVRQEGCMSYTYHDKITRARSGEYWGAKYLAARAYFDAHPPKPEYQDGDRVHYTQDGWDWLVARIDGEWVWENCPWGDYDEGEAVMNQRLFPRYDREIINTVNLKPGREYPAYVMPEVPKVGDYVRLTMKDGKTREGEVRETRLLRNVGYEPTEVRLKGNYSGYGYCYGKDPGDFNPKWQIVKVEKIVRVPEIGKWIEATTHDGKTHTFEVTKNKKKNYETQKPVFLGQKTSDWEDLFIYLKPEGQGRDCSRSIKSWKYVDAPANIVEIDGYFIVRDQDEVKVYDNKTTAEAHKYWGGLVHVTSVKHGYEKIAKYAQRDATYQRYIPALLAAIKFIEGGN